MSIDPDLDLLRDGFVPEMRDLVESAADALLRLETQPDDAVAVNDLFRVVHTIKGTAGMFDLPILVELVHAAEDLLGAVREGRVALSAAIVDDFFGCFDAIGAWVEAIDKTGQLPNDAADFARSRAKRYREALEGASPEAQGEAAPAALPEAAPLCLPAWVDLALRMELAPFVANAPSDQSYTLIRYAPRAECFFSGDDPLGLVRQISERLWLRLGTQAAWARPEEFDPYHCNLRFDVLSAAPRADIDHLLRYVLSETELVEIRKDTLFDGPFDPVSADILATQFRLACAPDCARDAIASAIGHVLRGAGFACAPEVVVAAVVDASEIGDDLPLRRLRAELTGEPFVEPAPEEATRAPEKAQSEPGSARSEADRALKIEPAKVDGLVDLVGELVVAKNALPFLAARTENHYGVRELAREIKQHYAVLDRITQELQASVMGIRMLPVAVIFRRFPRLVRDISRKLGKSVDLVIEGETTEADKTVIEALADPLLHLMRNSLDHGIELPAQREAEGKPATARLSLRAFQEGDKVMLRIEDDGRGIDPERIRASAVGKGLLSADAAALLSDTEAVNLIFLPGFSTADAVSDLSGRGVGMDAVRHAIEGLGGTVRLSSVVGMGTTVDLSLPLTLAVSKVMAIELAGQLYGIPMTQAAETVRVPKTAIRRFKTAEMMHLRDRMVPLVRLRERLCLPADPNSDTAEEAVLVVRIDGAPIGLIVDEFLAGMEVIMKPLGGILHGSTGFAGTAVLGDGKVLLILDLKEVL